MYSDSVDWLLQIDVVSQREDAVKLCLAFINNATCQNPSAIILGLTLHDKILTGISGTK